MIYTSRFQNPELKSGNYTVVGIVRGLPRFKLGYERAGNIIDIAPPREIFHINSREQFTAPYMAHLDGIGVERILAQLQKYVELGKDVVLCCYEDVRESDEWCHRLVFAEWWFRKTGEVIQELKDESPVKVKKKSTAIPKLPEEKPKKNFVVSEEEKLLIKIAYSIWKPGKKSYYAGGDVYYQVDKETGKTKRLFDEKARELISEGKADIVLDYESIEKVKFVLAKDSVVRAYRINKAGQQRDIDFKDAIKLVVNGMLIIRDIEIEN